MHDDGTTTDLEVESRRVFDAHHRRQSADPRILDRLTSLVSTDYFGLHPGWFAGRSVLDAGCGSNANASRAFLRLGAAHVHSVDWGSDWFEVARSVLAEFGGRSTLGAENILQLSIPDGTYDFVHCAGVLHHTADPRAGHAELVRVAKPGALVFVTVMAIGAGVLGQITNLMRDRYRVDAAFRVLIDNLTAAQLRTAIGWIVSERGRMERIDGDQERRFLESLVDDDLVLTVQDRLQAPTYHEFDFTEAQVRQWFADQDCDEVQRLSRYPTGFGNFRRFLSPMYANYSHPLSRLLFGEGYLQIIGRKRAGVPIVDTGRDGRPAISPSAAADGSPR